MRPTRVALALGLVLGGTVSCKLPTAQPVPVVRLSPILDSVFVGAQLPARTVTYYDASGVPHTPAPGQVAWSSSDTTILAVAVSGQLTGRKRGLAYLSATVQGTTGSSLVVVSNTLDLTLLLDTIYAMPGDTLTVPVAVKKSTAPPAVVWFKAPANAVYTIDSATGRLTAVGLGGPIPYFVHADTIADTGAVTVLSLADTTGGQFFFSAVGAVITHVGGSIRAANYPRAPGGAPSAFLLRGTTANQTVEIVLPDSVIATGARTIDSISATEASNGLVPLCAPPRPWGLWVGRTSSTTTLAAYSRRSGTLAITQLAPVTSGNGQAISGHFRYLAQRSDLYSDPLGVLTLQGSFVAPLVLDRTICK